MKIIKIFFLILFFYSHQAYADILPKETVEIQHPAASDGLIRIKEDGTYIYATETPSKAQSGHLYFGYANQPEITLEIENQTAGTMDSYTFDDFYGGASKLIIGYDFEWYPWISKAGRLGIQAGGSLMYAEGHGLLVSTHAPSVEKFYFLTVPINAGLVYRFQYKEKQLIAPYVAGGGILLGLAEKREDVSTVHFTGGLGFYGAGGIMLNVGLLDEETGFNLESEYGIGNMWFVAEIRLIEVPSEAFSFSNQIMNAGFSFDF